MIRVYLTGHHTFSNRGCEAIVRSTVSLLHEQFGAVEILVPSSDLTHDQRQWPEAGALGVTFVPAYLPIVARFWAHAQKHPIPGLRELAWPFPLPSRLKRQLREVDCVLSVGGDNYSLDYLRPSLLMGMDRCAMRQGTAVVLWGASIGPFEADPPFLRMMRHHLNRMALITARESETARYLSSLEVSTRVIHVADPAFALVPLPVDVAAFWPKEHRHGVLGMNVSPLLQRFRPVERGGRELIHEVARFLRHVIHERELSVLLIPHVIPHTDDNTNNDATFMREILSKIDDREDRIRMAPTHLNAAQMKYVISQCRFFLGARTHSTIAAISTGVPTLSIAYSRKAVGLNQDVFGNARYILDSRLLGEASLKEGLARLMEDEPMLRLTLRQTGLEMRDRAYRAVQCLASEVLR